MSTTSKTCQDCPALLPDTGSGEHLRKRCSEHARAEKRRLKAIASQRWAEANRERMRAYGRDKRREWRALVIETYGGVCSCPGCHVHHEQLLTVDHVNGDGHHRRNRRSTRDIYRQIILAGFPPEFQLLCGSCNLAKSDGDKCPLAEEDH